MTKFACICTTGGILSPITKGPGVPVCLLKILLERCQGRGHGNVTKEKESLSMIIDAAFLKISLLWKLTAFGNEWLSLVKA